MLDNLDLEKLSNLPSYVQRLFEALKPALAQINLNKINREKSKIDIEKNGRKWTFVINIYAKDERIPPLTLFASKKQCILGLAEHEEIECHTISQKDEDGVIKEVVLAAEKYLKGITILEHYDKNNKVFKKTFYYGLDTEGMKEQIIGSCSHGFCFFRRSQHIEKTVHSFM